LNPNDDETPYRLEKLGTGGGVGWFSCVPAEDTDLEAGFDHLSIRPLDRFMVRHVLSLCSSLELGDMAGLIERGQQGEPHVLALAFEVCAGADRFHGLLGRFDREALSSLAAHSPSICIPWSLYRKTTEHLYWVRCFSRNAALHEPLPRNGEAEHDPLVSDEAIEAWKKGVVPIQRMNFEGAVSDPAGNDHSGQTRTAVREVQNRLEKAGLLEGWETRTEATLSPFAVERRWRLDIRTRQGRHAWHLSGTQTSYGRGMDIHRARISCLMEIVERASAFASFAPDRVTGVRGGLGLIRGSARELEAEGRRVLNLERVCLEVPYRDDPLCWVQGEEVGPHGREEVLVPAQLVFLFANLDEVSLTSGLSSNGLGAGETLDQARLSALLEVIERDAERVMPFRPERCFVLKAEDGRVSEMLESLQRKGIFICLRDMTTEFGVPCYQAFVRGPGGVVLKGCGAHLDARRAVVSAMTEIPWPYPYWFGTAPPPDGMPRVRYEDLPGWSTGSVSNDLRRLESLVTANGYQPVYVDLTREDLEIPVCRALVPGLEMMTFFDRFTPLGVRQFGHYMASVQE